MDLNVLFDLQIKIDGLLSDFTQRKDFFDHTQPIVIPNTHNMQAKQDAETRFMDFYTAFENDPSNPRLLRYLLQAAVIFANDPFFSETLEALKEFRTTLAAFLADYSENSDFYLQALFSRQARALHTLEQSNDSDSLPPYTDITQNAIIAAQIRLSARHKSISFNAQRLFAMNREFKINISDVRYSLTGNCQAIYDTTEKKTDSLTEYFVKYFSLETLAQFNACYQDTKPTSKASNLPSLKRAKCITFQDAPPKKPNTADETKIFGVKSRQ